MTTVLVTGGAGYIGSHTCKSLAASGFTPVAYDHLVQGHKYAVKWGPLEVGDILDQVRLGDVLRRYQPSIVVHFAGLADVAESVRDPGMYYQTNVAGTISLLEAMRACNVRQIIFSSTCATYGAPRQQPINEDTPKNPINPYGRSKLIVEHLLRDYHSAYGLGSVVLRYFNACGADPDGEVGEHHDPETRLIPRGLMAVTGDISSLEVFGSDYDTQDGTCIRDYIHVTDLAEGHVRALTYLIDGNPSIVFNLGIGKGFSVREIIESIERVTGHSVPISEGLRRPGDPATLTADPSRARDVLGFCPRFTDLDEMVDTAWRWHQQKRAKGLVA